MEGVRLEIWIPSRWLQNCAGCVFLGTIGPLPSDVGPFPPLHPNCGCRREALDLDVLQPWDKVRVALWANRNRRAASEIRRIAYELAGIRDPLASAVAAVRVPGRRGPAAQATRVNVQGLSDEAAEALQRASERAYELFNAAGEALLPRRRGGGFD